MKVINKKVLVDFKKKHSVSRKALDNWLNVTKKAIWGNFSDIKKTFNSADKLKGK